MMAGRQTHACPGGCGDQITYERLACPTDWSRLPNVLRHDVNAAWRNRARDGVAHLLAVRAAMRWYRDNRPS
jgi:hypothetical protein